MKYERAVILGTGKLCISCAAELKSRGCYVEVFDTNPTPSAQLERRILDAKITFAHLDKRTLFDMLTGYSYNTLLVSAVNPLIIPKRILSKENILSVNLHQALLPAHPGRNAEAWAIFEEDTESGITWHLVTENIDAGRILIQKSTQITETMNSLDLFRMQMDLAETAFREIIDPLLEGNCSFSVFPSGAPGKIHYSWEIPNNSFLDLNWNGKKISAFLRAMDYGILKVLGNPKIVFGNQVYEWKKSKIELPSTNLEIPDSIEIGADTITIVKDQYRFSLTQCLTQPEGKGF